MTAPRRPIEVREFPRPALPEGAALLRTSCSEVCGTDVHLWHGRLSGVAYPIIPGHVSAGTIEASRGPLTGVDGSPAQAIYLEPGIAPILERHGGSIPFRRIGARRYGLGELNDALADAEAMRIPKALVDPWKS